MKKANCWVIVNCGEQPSFGGEFDTPEDIIEYYEKYDTFTKKIYTSVRQATAQMNRLDEQVEEGKTCYVVCGAYCKLYDRR